MTTVEFNRVGRCFIDWATAVGEGDTCQLSVSFIYHSSSPIYETLVQSTEFDGIYKEQTGKKWISGQPWYRNILWSEGKHKKNMHSSTAQYIFLVHKLAFLESGYHLCGGSLLKARCKCTASKHYLFHVKYFTGCITLQAEKKPIDQICSNSVQLKFLVSSHPNHLFLSQSLS